MNTNIVFSRYLYNVDEVLLTFVERLLKQSSLEECYFWIYEYYKSGFEKETWNFIWKVYYDFYAYNFPKMERKIIQFYKKWKTTHDFINIMHIVKNLHRFTPKATSKIMLLRTYYSTRLVRIFKQNPKFKLEVECTNKYEELLVRSIFEKCWESTAYYLKKIIKSSNSSKLLENILKKKIKTNHFYEDEFHQLIIKIINNKDESKWYIHKTSIEEMNKVLESDQKAIGNYDTVNYIYKTLEQKRLYGISTKIGCFKLNRFNINLNEIFWYNWEYYAYFSPLWKKRFDKYEIKIDNENKKIEFIGSKADDDCENFYENYGYEPDEQKKEVQEKSTKDIPKKRLDTWINSIFETQIKRRIRMSIVY